MPGQHNPRKCLFPFLLSALVWLAVAPPAWAQAGLPLYTVSPDDNQLRSVDPLTGRTLASRTITVGGLTVLGATGLARHPQSGRVYALVTLAGQRNSELVTLDLGGGAATRIGNTGDRFHGLAFTGDGKLLSLAVGSAAEPGVLFVLDTTRGFAAPVGNPGDGAAQALGAGAATTPWRGDFSLRADAKGSLFLVDPEGTTEPLSRLDHRVAGLAMIGSASACTPRPALVGAASTATGGPSFFYSIDGANGAASLIGPIGFAHVTALDFGAANTLFAIGERVGGSGETVLLTIDFCTGLGSVVGPTGLRAHESITDLAYRKSDKTLFAYIEPSHELATVNFSTGAVSRLGPVGGDSGGGLAVRSDGALLHAAGAVLARLDPPSLTENISVPFAFAEPGASLQLSALDFASSGKLFALAKSGGVVDLAVVDPFSGEVTSLGHTQEGLTALAALTLDPDLILSMSASPDPLVVTGNLTYIATVANAGPDQATGVTLTDNIPAGVNFTSATASQGSCAQNMGVVTCDLGMIDALASATATIVLSPQNTGPLTNTASVTLNEVDPDTSNNTASVTADVVDFSIAVMPASVTVTRGNTAVYTVTLAPIGGRFDFNIILDCENQPASTQCNFLPPNATPGGGPIDITLNLLTTAPTSAANPQPSFPLYAAWLLAPLGLLALGVKRHRAPLVLLLLVFLLALQVGCGGSSNNSSSGGVTGTPVGTHSFTIRGVVGPVQRRVDVQVVVQ